MTCCHELVSHLSSCDLSIVVDWLNSQVSDGLSHYNLKYTIFNKFINYTTTKFMTVWLWSHIKKLFCRYELDNETIIMTWNSFLNRGIKSFFHFTCIQLLQCWKCVTLIYVEYWFLLSLINQFHFIINEQSNTITTSAVQWTLLYIYFKCCSAKTVINQVEICGHLKFSFDQILIFLVNHQLILSYHHGYSD